MFEPAANFNPKDRGFVVTFPDFPEVVTQGSTEEEAMEMAADVLGIAIEHYVDKGEPLPRPKKYRGSKYRTVRLPALPAAKVALYNAFIASGIRKAELARQLGMHRANVDRLFNLKHQSRLDQIEAALKALGKQLSIDVQDAA